MIFKPWWLVAAVAIPTVPLAETKYAVTDLGAFFPTAMNSRGQVVGVTESPSRAVLWTPNSPNGTSGSLSYPLGTEGDYSAANDINSFGQVVGTYGFSPGNGVNNIGFVWTPDLANATSGTWFGLGDYTTAYGINAMGQVCGFSDLWTPDTPNGTTGTSVSVSSAFHFSGYKINDFGQIIGTHFPAGGQVAALWTPSSANGDSGTLDYIGPTQYSDGVNLNSFGAATGQLNTTVHHAYLWVPDSAHGTTGTLTDLDGNADRWSAGSAVSDANVVVGFMFTDQNDIRAFATISGSMVDLNGFMPQGSSYTLDWATDITSKGQIICSAHVTGSSVKHAFLLSPQTAQGEIQDIQSQVQHLVQLGAELPANGQSLYAKLNSAIAKLNNGDTAGTISDLKAFINQVKSFIKTKKISQTDGQALIDAANAIIAELGG
jgi:hypothetical protein